MMDSTSLSMLVVQVLIPGCLTQDYPEWHGGDWALDSLQFTPEPVNNTNEWAHYLNTLGEDYDEYPVTRLTREPFVPPKDEDLVREPLDWHPLSPSEDPYLAVLFRKDGDLASKKYWDSFPGEPNPFYSHVEAGTACGAAFMTPKYVLTSCGCVLTLMSRVIGFVSPFAPGEATYDIYDEYIHQLTAIYVTHSLTRFDVSYVHSLDTSSKTLWPANKDLNCVKIIEQASAQFKCTNNCSPGDKIKIEAMINAEPVIVPVQPKIKTNFFRYFPRWPPFTISKPPNQNYSERVNLVSIGMVISKRGKVEFFSSISASTTLLQHCDGLAEGFGSKVCAKDLLQSHLDGSFYRATCFCRVTRVPMITGGVIGWPLEREGQLVGISGSERHPLDGTMVGITMTPTRVKAMEDFLNITILLEQNIPPPPWRWRDLKERFQVYNYDEFKDRTTKEPHSTAVYIRPALSVYALIGILNFIGV